jgi:cystathionine beta-lyase/cystathionine gamma-synthase
VASDQLYGRTSNLIKEQLPRFGVTSARVDINDLDQVRGSLQVPTRLLVVETISNPLLRVANIPALAEIAHQRNCLLLVDNTFATPVLFRPLDHGADLVMESLGKTIGGHSDLTLGALSGRDASLQSGIAAAVSAWGLAPPQLECWLAQRSLPTLELRMRAATANAAELAWSLQEHSGLARVIYPGLPSHSDHALAAEMLPEGCGSVLSIELKEKGRDAVNRFMQRARGIPFCPSLGDVITTCSHPATTSHRYHSAEERARQGISDGLIRLSIGIEPVDQILREIEKGLGSAPAG